MLLEDLWNMIQPWWSIPREGVSDQVRGMQLLWTSCFLRGSLGTDSNREMWKTSNYIFPHPTCVALCTSWAHVTGTGRCKFEPQKLSTSLRNVRYGAEHHWSNRASRFGPESEADLDFCPLGSSQQLSKCIRIHFWFCFHQAVLIHTAPSMLQVASSNRWKIFRR